jgi:hypothetical protein
VIRLDDLLCDGKVLPNEDVNVAVVVDLCHGLKFTRLQKSCQVEFRKNEVKPESA